MATVEHERQMFYADPSATSNNWWTAANVADASKYCDWHLLHDAARRPGGAVPTAGTAFNAAFAGLTPAQINGTWTLTITDNTSGDIGSVSAASLTLVAGAPPAIAYAPTPNAAPRPSPSPAGCDHCRHTLWRQRQRRGVDHQ